MNVTSVGRLSAGNETLLVCHVHLTLHQQPINNTNDNTQVSKSPGVEARQYELSWSASNFNRSLQNATSIMAEPVCIAREYHGLPAPAGSQVPTPKDLISLCTQVHPDGWCLGLAYPPESPVFGSSMADQSSGTRSRPSRWPIENFSACIQPFGHRGSSTPVNFSFRISTHPS